MLLEAGPTRLCGQPPARRRPFVRSSCRPADILAGGRRWVLERLIVEANPHDASIFTVRT
jgi:hypothetical protein